MLRLSEQGVGTHVLIVGVGYYRSSRIPALSSAERSANVLADWWANNFVNTTAPLRSLEVLSSSRGGNDDGETDFEAIATAIRSWRSRVSAHPENIAVFHFTGHGIQTPSGYCLLAGDFNQDSADGESSIPADQAISADELVSGFGGLPDRQIWMFDASRASPGETHLLVRPRPVLVAQKELSGAVRRLVMFATGPGQLAYADAEGDTVFTRAFIETVRANSDHLDTAQLVEQMSSRIGAAEGAYPRQLPETLLTKPFELIFRGNSEISEVSDHWGESSVVEKVIKITPLSMKSQVDPKKKPLKPRKRRATKSDQSSASSDSTTSIPPSSPAREPISAQAATRVPTSFEPQSPRPDLEFHDDAAQVEADSLGRGALAVVVARRLHAVWRKSNSTVDATAIEDHSSFVMHLDAPWGGGKTTFANFISRVLNPFGYGAKPARFLRERYGETAGLGAIFVADPPKEGEAPPQVSEAHRRPWIIIEYNAWRMEHTSPPWWTFYQVIRRGSFGAIRREGTCPSDLAEASRPKNRPVRNTLSWIWLWLNELFWRLWTPKLIVPLIGFVLSAFVLFVLWKLGWVGSYGEAKKEKIGFNADVWPSRIVAGLGALTVIGGVISLIMESLAPGVDPVAERIGLGRSDPLERFRKHFHRTMCRLERPVLVIVDDLDRCKPAVIVDLVRGIQTILRSPRVVFLVLGDRNWLECAFEAVHTDMAKVVGGIEQSVGARFVEKAIQLSFILPGLDPARQSSFVADLLRGTVDAPATTAAASSTVELRAVARAAAKLEPTAAFDSSELRATVLDAPEGRELVQKLEEHLSKDAVTSGQMSLQDEARRQAAQIVNEEIAIQAAVAPSVEAETAKRLEPLALWLPGNPRQIKRILNGIALYHAAGLQHPTFSTAERWFQLALWIVLMTEWPMTWRLLSACPELADILCDKEPLKKLAKVDASVLPGSMEATEREVGRILNSSDLMALIAGKGGREGDKIDTAAVRDLLTLTPPNTKLPRLPESEKKEADAGGGKSKKT